MLFSEPKIPQSSGRAGWERTEIVSVLFSEPKIPQSFSVSKPLADYAPVSVLFSEPKIPQSSTVSAMRETSSAFQCSSASRKFLNTSSFIFASVPRSVSVLFSEPKIPQWRLSINEPSRARQFQCSSASRKFLNRVDQRVEVSDQRVSVLFSEPKIPQLSGKGGEYVSPFAVSVLFSEPKIPQLGLFVVETASYRGFSALQRAENSSIATLAPASIHIPDCDDHASSFLSLPGASP